MRDEAHTPSATGWEGKTLRGKYRIVRCLGTGGWGAVFEAEHLLLRRSVAIKVLHPDFAADPRFAERFRREALAASRIGHPSIIEVLDLDTTDDGTQFMVLELLRGESFGDVIDRGVRLSIAGTLAILEPITDALAAAHRAGIVHRDIKPDNIFLSRRPDGRILPKLLDFGIAKVDPLSGDATATITQTGAILGTPVYMPPEQIRGERSLDHHADIYSLGVVFYEALAGVLPFVGENLPTVVSKILEEAPVPLDVIRPDVPLALAVLVDAMLEKEPSRRPASCDEILAALHTIAETVEQADLDEEATTIFSPTESAEMAAQAFANDENDDTVTMSGAESAEMLAFGGSTDPISREVPRPRPPPVEDPPSVILGDIGPEPKPPTVRFVTPPAHRPSEPPRRSDRSAIAMAIGAFVLVATISYVLFSRL